MMGVQLGPVEAERAQRRLELSPGQGAEVMAVLPNSPAMRAGMLVGDVITEIDGKSVGPESARQYIAIKKAGQEVAIKYLRWVDGTPVRFDLRMQLAPRSDDREPVPAPVPAPTPPPSPRPLVPPAIEVTPVEPAPAPPAATTGGVKLGARVRQEPDFQLTIVDVVPGGHAALAGLREGDTLLRVAGREVKTLESLREVLERQAPGSESTIDYRHGDGIVSCRLEWGVEGKAGRVLSQAVAGPTNAKPTPAPEPAPAPDRHPPRIGVTLEERVDGLAISNVEAKSCAAEMGLVAGDRLLELNGTAVRTRADVRNLLRGLKAGDALEIKYLRDGTTRVVKGKLGSSEPGRAAALPGERAVPAQAHAPAAAPGGAVTGAPSGAAPAASEDTSSPNAKRPYLGIKVQEAIGERSLRIVGVDPGSPAERAGLRAGDTLASVGGVAVASLDALRDRIAHHAPGARLETVVIREGRATPISCDLAEQR